ncbi:hypothetical protein DICPUDRAFT_43700 [Dictyostelium purpureum]|uniref:Alpha-1,3-glucosyltransferase n=1 Tax=Dictyostelium purpureum TaxID=5786 RepID=F1A4M3_DICPU|nr:uncharacterized protein DICPUDRAFT_43700 [Dictyostelium purpureum]EGC28859.1 hypothetical protein DICPUDRAFT_43700 [Dictyostelium purpureum]|eukprot:XP_003294619.1 hypothetical protein DICPUDRAFT_43700 [Dictyostelium purpureum]
MLLKTKSLSTNVKISLFLLMIVVSLLARYLVSLNSYSGQGKPPMFGDYEAQRHWMEITTKLDVHEWYFNTTDNNLLYWGLDYPPLTAYLSWVYGKIGEIVEPASMELYTSRGYETPTSKLFMRATVIVSDLIIWIPSVWFFVTSFYKDKTITQKIGAFLFISLQPGLLLIDHGHFQYNGVSLGLALFAITFIIRDQQLLASIFFVLSLNYKQMSLYYAPAFFFYLLFSNLEFSFSKLFSSFFKILKIGLVVIATFIICWIPFLSIEQASQVLFRLFPFSRGLFEDKVANFWCFISVFINMKKLFSTEVLIKLCLILTLATMIPLFINLFKNKNSKFIFLYSLINSSFSFFLFSFQVHEKTILLPLLPVSLLILHHPNTVWWFSVISTFSMFPLLFKDGLIIPYISIMVFFIVFGYQYKNEILKSFNNLNDPKTTSNKTMASSKSITSIISSLLKINVEQYSKYWYALNIVGMIVCHLLYQFVPQPSGLPALWLLLVCNFSFIHFTLTLLDFIIRMFTFNPTKVKTF